MKPRRLVAVVCSCLISTAAACSSNPGRTSASSSTAPSSTPTSPAASGGGSGSGIAAIPVADRSPAGTFGKEPAVVVPSGPPPTVLEAADLIAGSGKAVSPGDTVTVQYVGYSWTYKALFDASWSDGSGAPVSFPLSGVIKGWSEGLVGMKLGGRRELIIPPSLAYGSASPSAKIAANDTLVFIVDLIKIG